MHAVDGGKTVRIVLRGCETGLSDASFIEWAIASLCEHLGMTPVGPPVMREIPPGLSCVLVIAESHIAVHTWPETSSVRVVIDCCVEFDYDAAVGWLRDAFGAESYVTGFV